MACEINGLAGRIHRAKIYQIERRRRSGRTASEYYRQCLILGGAEKTKHIETKRPLNAKSFISTKVGAQDSFS